MAELERNEISIHEVKTYLVLIGCADRWLTNKDIVGLTEGVALRTVSAFTAKFVQMQLVDQAEVFPAHRFRWSDKAQKRNQSYVLRLQTAASVFGLDSIKR